MSTYEAQAKPLLQYASGCSVCLSNPDNYSVKTTKYELEDINQSKAVGSI